jgi:streptogramin lyase
MTEGMFVRRLILAMALFVTACGGDSGDEDTGGFVGVIPGSETTSTNATVDEDDVIETEPAEGGSDCPADELCEIQVGLDEIPLDVDADSITIDEKGTGWVTSSDSGAVLEVDLAGGEVTRSIGVEEGAIDLTIGPDALWLVVNEFGTGKLQRIDPATGDLIAEIDTEVTGGPRSVAMGEGAVWTVLDGYGRVGRVDPADNSVTVVDVNNNFVGGGIEAPVIVAHGVIWAVDASHGVLKRVDPSGETLGVVEDLGFSSTTSGDTTSIFARGPVALSSSEEGIWVLSEVHVEEDGNNLSRGALFLLDPVSAEIIQRVDLISAPAHARPGLALSDGAAWYINFVDSFPVRVDLQTGRQTFIRPPGLGEISKGVTSTADGSIIHFVTEGGFEGGGAVYGVDPAEAATASS